jgi:methylglutaconyl-CoA hydratase
MKYIRYSKRDRIGTIVMDRPEKRNALDGEIVSELEKAFVTAEKDEDVKIVILKAKGDSFCAGADLAYLQNLQRFSYEENLADSGHLRDLFQKMFTMGKIVIAQVQGDAIAGGCGLITCCDFVFSVPNARFGYPEVKIGFIPAIVTVFLLRKIGPGKTRELLLTGDLVSAEAALGLGLVNQIKSPDTIENDVMAFAGKLVTSNSANSMSMTKQMLAEVPTRTLSDALQYACEMNAKARASDDCKAGIAAFLNKESIRW